MATDAERAAFDALMALGAVARTGICLAVLLRDLGVLMCAARDLDDVTRATLCAAFLEPEMQEQLAAVDAARARSAN